MSHFISTVIVSALLAAAIQSGLSIAYDLAGEERGFFELREVIFGVSVLTLFGYLFGDKW